MVNLSLKNKKILNKKKLKKKKKKKKKLLNIINIYHTHKII